jgi:hypothetical protein
MTEDERFLSGIRRSSFNAALRAEFSRIPLRDSCGRSDIRANSAAGFVKG